MFRCFSLSNQCCKGWDKGTACLHFRTLFDYRIFNYQAWNARTTVYESLKIVDDLSLSLSKAPGTVGLKIKEKLETVLAKNPGLATIRLYSTVLMGGTVQEEIPSPSILQCFKFAPCTSCCDVERSFSVYKNILADNRQSLKSDNIEKILILYCAAKSL
jgi:hypothetical protein